MRCQNPVRPTVLALTVLVATTLLAIAGLAGCTQGSEPAAPSATASQPAETEPSDLASDLPDGLHSVRLGVAAGASAGAAAGRSLSVPAGWSAQVWAAVDGARMAAWTPDGRLLVTAADRGELHLLTPRGDGGAPGDQVVARGLDDPQGVAVSSYQQKTVVVLGEATRIVRWVYADGRLSDPGVVIGGLPAGGHSGKFVAVRDGIVAYNVGSATNRDAADRLLQPKRATVEQVRLDGTDHRLLAVGVRNGEGLSYAPDGTLFAAVNQADNQPYPFEDGTGLYGKTSRAYINEHPNDQVTRIEAGADLGWPYCVPDSRSSEALLDLGYVNDPTSNATGAALNCASVTRTQVGLPAHSAPIGFGFTAGSALTGDLAKGALITVHGSWNRQPPRPPSVSFSTWDASTKTLTEPRTIVSGFQNADGERWGRSVDAVPGPDGAIYVTDDRAGLIYRIVPAGQ